MQARLKESWKIFLPKGYQPWSVKAGERVQAPVAELDEVASLDSRIGTVTSRAVVESSETEAKKVFFLYLESEEAAKVAAEKMKKPLTTEVPAGYVLELMSQEKFLDLDSGIRQNSSVICLFEKSADFFAEKIFSSGSFAEIEKNSQKKKEFWGALKSWVSSL